MFLMKVVKSPKWYETNLNLQSWCFLMLFLFCYLLLFCNCSHCIVPRFWLLTCYFAVGAFHAFSLMYCTHCKERRERNMKIVILLSLSMLFMYTFYCIWKCKWHLIALNYNSKKWAKNSDTKNKTFSFQTFFLI